MLGSLHALVQARRAELDELGACGDAALSALYLALAVSPLRAVYSWALPSEEALSAVAAASPGGVVEVGAGSGLWARLLRERGVAVAASDAAPAGAKERNGWHADSPPFSPLLCRDGRAAAAAYPLYALLLCFPPRESDERAPLEARTLGADALAAYGGETLLYVRDGDATGGPLLHGALQRGWALSGTVQLPQWWAGAQAELTIWKRAATSLSAAAVAPVSASDWPPPSTAGFAPSEEAAHTDRRRAMLDSIDLSWASAAAAHIAARRLGGGARARPGAEGRAVAAAVSAAPFLRRLLLRALC